MSTSQISKLTIRGFKSIKELHRFELRPMNVLIGPNGTGKSNFVSFFRMLYAMVDRRLRSYILGNEISADRILSYGVKRTQSFYSMIEFGSNAYEFNLKPTQDGLLYFDHECVGLCAYDFSEITALGGNMIESNLKDNGNTIAGCVYESISNWRIYHFHDTSLTAGVKYKCSLLDCQYLRIDASNLAAYLYFLKFNKKEQYRQIVRMVQLALPYFDDFVLEPIISHDGEQNIILAWRQKDSDYVFWPSQLSDGSLRFICLVTALLQDCPPATIIVDEPELGLHPLAISLLGNLLKSAATRMQVIVSTQSVPLLNEFSLDDIIVVERENGESKFKRLVEADFTDWLQDYTIGELWEKNVLGGRP